MTTILGSNGADTITGTNNSDIILAGNGNDIVNGGSGNDLIEGGNGSDILNGGAGADIVDGGNGNDTVNGGSGADLLSGGSGNDTLDGGSGADLVLAGQGDDVVIHIAAENTGTINVYDGGSGRDTLRLVIDAAIAASAAFQADLAQAQQSISRHGSASGVFDSLGIVFTSFERIEVVIAGGGNQAPTDIVLSASTVAENTAGAVIGTLSTVDPDAGNTHSYTVNDTRFEVVGNTLKLKAGESLDYETAPTVSIDITSTDAGGLSRTETFTVSVANVNEGPTDVALAGSTVAENTAGAVIGTLSTVDPDAGNTHSYTVSDTRFEVVGNTLKLKAGESLDYETAPTVSIDITSTDAGGLSRTETFTVSVTNVNEGPTDVALAGSTVAENTAGAVIGTLSTVDPDAGNTHSYTVSDTRFEVVGNTLKLKAGESLDYETAPTVSIDITSTDAGGLSRTETFTVDVTNVNEGPTAINLDNAVVNENAAGAAIGTLSGVDPDAGDTLTFSVDDGRFEVVSNVLRLKDGAALDYDQEPEVLVVVTATDSAGNTFDRGFTIDVTEALEGTASDGYVAGATVFADTNNNGVLDSGEVSTTTDAFGQFSLFGGSGSLVMFGGTDISTGKPFLGTMRAPEGSAVVTPLTTLVAAIADTGATVEEANDLVLAGLGLEPGIDLSSFDPIAATLSSDPILQEQGAASIAAAIQVQNTIVQAAAVLEGAGGDFGSAATSVVAAIASQISQAPNAEIDLGSGSVVSDVINEAAATTSGVSATAVSNVIADVALVITSSNQLIETAASTSTGTNLLESLAQVSSVAQSAAESLTTAVSTGNTTSVTTDFTGPNLQTAVDAATVGDVVGVNGPDTVTGTAAADTLYGYGGNDTLIGLEGNDILVGGDGDDTIDGGAGINRAVYIDATGGITVALAAGTVSGAGVGTDTLSFVEYITGSNFADSYDAMGFGQAGALNIGSTGTLNGIEGMGGSDIITGNGNTLVSYRNAAARVTVDLLAGTGQGIDAGDVANVGTDTLAGVSGVLGSAFNDVLRGSGSAGFELFNGNGGDDLIDGRVGFDRVVYSSILDDTVTGGVSIDMAAGIVIGDSSVGTDTLRGVESVRGSRFDDTYVATGFSGSSDNAGSNGTFNEFEGAAGNDAITGNGNTRIAFYNATAGVTVDLAAGIAAATSADASIGTDTWSTTAINNFIGGINAITGSQFGDTLYGSNNAAGTSEQFEGRAGNDSFDGRGGFDVAVYNNDLAVNAGIVVDMAAGTVTSTSAAIGTDTLQGIEGIRGTNLADTYDATGFGPGSTNAGTNGTFNEFAGMGGSDTITGNGNTQIAYGNATAGVTVDLEAGTAVGDVSVGTDTILGGVSRVLGSNFNDTITGDEFNNILNGQGGNDTINGGAGNDTLTGGGGADTFVFTDGSGFDTITDFLQGQGDKINLTGVTGLYDFATLQTLATQGNPHTVFDFGGGNVLTLNNVTLGSLNASSFIFAANPAPTDLSLSADIAPENSAAGTVIGLVQATDNPGDTLTFELLNDAGGRFALNGANELVVVGALDYESAISHQVTLRVTDSASNTYEETLTVQVSDVNEAPTDIALSVSTIAENSANDTVVGTLSASDPDTGDTATFELLDDAGGLFALNGSNEIVVAGALDYESATSHQITVRVTDGASNVHEETLTIGVTNVAGNIAGTPDADPALIGTEEEDIITAQGGDDILQGLAGNDILDGGTGTDRAIYSDATGGITVNLAAGTVSGAGVGSDTLVSVESIIASNFADSYNATGFGPDSTNAASAGTLNGFEGLGGDDTITGNGNTLASYINAAAGVTVDLQAGTGQGTDAGDVANVGTDTLTGVFGALGSAFNDILRGSNNSAAFELFNGNAGDDLIDGRVGFDRVNYSSLVLADDTVTGGVGIDMASGIVTGDLSVGTDTLRAIESVRGSRFADTYVATGFSGSSDNAGSNGTFNEFEGMHGNDTITGNGNTRIAFYNATAGVTVDLLSGTATGDDSVGTDTWSTSAINNFIGGINAITGSQFGDTLLGSNNPSLTAELFEGRAGNDTIDGRGGFDQAIYSNDSAVTSGISVTVAGGNLDWIVTGSDAVGTDTLTATESIRGTNFADTFDATNFNGASTDTVPLGANFNEFEGMGGDDVITGNGNTRISYGSATAAVTVNLTAGAGTASGNLSVGTDTFTGVSRVRGSNFDDLFAVTSGTYVLEGQNGNDTLSFASFAGPTGVSVNLGVTAAQTYAGTSTVTLNSIEKLIGSAFNDTLTGSGAANIITGGGGDDTINGNAGTDIVIFSGARSDYTISGTTTLTVEDTRSGAPDGIDSLTNVELLRFSDAFYMAATSFSLSGLNTIAGNTLFGTANSDTLTLTPLSNNATIDLGGGSDTVMLTGPGPAAGYTLGLINVENVTADATSNSNNVNETLNLTYAVNGISIDLGSGTDLVKVANGVNSLSVTNVESLTGSDFSGSSDDVLTLLNNVSGLSVNLANGTNSLNLAAGSNSFGDIWGVGTINGTVDDDTLSISGNASAVAIDLGGGTDNLNLTNGITGTNITVTNVESVNGTDYADTVVIANTSGSTTVVGGGGADQITASAGSDYFGFNASSDSSAGALRDIITGFDASQDAFHFSSSGFAGITFDYIETVAFTGNAGQIRLDGNVLQIDLDGDGMVGSGDMEIDLDGHAGTLSTANFLLV